MPRKSNIRWRRQDRAELSKVVGNFNRALTNTIKKYGDSIKPFLPDKIVVSTIKNEIKNRSDFNSKIDELKKANVYSLSPVVTTKGITTTNYEIEMLRSRVKTINRNRKKELKKISPSPETGSMGSIASNNLKPKPFDIKNIKTTDWNAFKKSVMKQSRPGYVDETHNLYKENYLKAIREILGSAGDDLYDYVSGLPASFVFYTYSINENVQFEFVYAYQEAEYIAERALNTWKTLNDDLDEF